MTFDASTVSFIARYAQPILPADAYSATEVKRWISAVSDFRYRSRCDFSEMTSVEQASWLS